MKKTVFIPVFLLLFTMFSCNLFKKKESEPIVFDTTTVVVDTTPVYIPGPTRAHEDVFLLEEINDKFLIIVGSFESVNLALEHAAKYGTYGLDTKVIQKPDGFFMVTARAFEDFETAKKELISIRKKYAKKSWVFANERMLDMETLQEIENSSI